MSNTAGTKDWLAFGLIIEIDPLFTYLCEFAGTSADLDLDFEAAAIEGWLDVPARPGDSNLPMGSKRFQSGATPDFSPQEKNQEYNRQCSPDEEIPNADELDRDRDSPV